MLGQEGQIYIHFQNLIVSSQVIEVEMMLESGEIKRYSNEENADQFKAVVLSLGALGVILTVKLQCGPAYDLERSQYPMKFDDVFSLSSFSVHFEAHSDSLLQMINSFDSLVNDKEFLHMAWFPHTEHVQCIEWKRTKKVIRAELNF